MKENASIAVELSGMKMCQIEMAINANRAASKNPPRKEKLRFDLVAYIATPENTTVVVANAIMTTFAPAVMA